MLIPTVSFLIIVICSYTFFFHNYLEICLFAQLETSLLGKKTIINKFSLGFLCTFARTTAEMSWDVRGYGELGKSSTTLKFPSNSLGDGWFSQLL